jgi:hypothetical protein
MSTDQSPPSDVSALLGGELEVQPNEVRAYLAAYPEAAGLDVIRLLAYHKARRARPDLTEVEFQRLSSLAFESSYGREGLVAEILAAVATYRPPPPPRARRGRPVLNEADVRRELLAARDAEMAKGIERPTREAIAEAMGVDPTTLRRYLRRYPDLRSLLPSSGSPRRA